MDLSKFWVVTPITNPIRFKSRIELYRKFEKHMKDSGVNLMTVECAFGDRPWEFTEANDPGDLRQRTFEELWQKEAMINAGIARLPPDWEYVAWIDSDIMFQRQDWAVETWHQLQHFMVVQPWATCIDMGPNLEIIQTHKSFCYQWWRNDFRPPVKSGYYPYDGSFFHPGYAWAARREAIDYLGGILDWAILGAGDHHIALALIGAVDKSCPLSKTSRYYKKLKLYEERALKYIKKDIGYCDGIILHGWHGKKKDRRYRERWDILTKNDYNPDTDLRRDAQGLWQLNVDTVRQERLRDEIRGYFRNRAEDSIDL